jgi:hypothetical protein
MDVQTKQETEVAVAQLRLFIAAYEDSEPIPGSRTARQLDAARSAVAAYDAAHFALAEHVAKRTA